MSGNFKRKVGSQQVISLDVDQSIERTSSCSKDYSSIDDENSQKEGIYVVREQMVLHHHKAPTTILRFCVKNLSVLFVLPQPPNLQTQLSAVFSCSEILNWCWMDAVLALLMILLIMSERRLIYDEFLSINKEIRYRHCRIF